MVEKFISLVLLPKIMARTARIGSLSNHDDNATCSLKLTQFKSSGAPNDFLFKKIVFFDGANVA